MMVRRWRGVIHIHSLASYDCITSIPSIAKAAVARRLDFVIVTDHDSLEGALALRDYVDSRALQLEVPIAGEYRTSHGDVIAAFLKGDDEIASREIEEFVREVRSRDGILLLPHPFSSHTEIEWLASRVDLVETFNGRQSDALNRQAMTLAKSLAMRTYPGADAHILSNIDAAIACVRGSGTLREALVASGAELLSSRGNASLDVLCGQAIKAVRTRNPRLLAYALAAPVYRRFVKPLVRRGRRSRPSEAKS